MWTDTHPGCLIPPNAHIPDELSYWLQGYSWPDSLIQTTINNDIIFSILFYTPPFVPTSLPLCYGSYCHLLGLSQTRPPTQEAIQTPCRYQTIWTPCQHGRYKRTFPNAYNELLSSTLSIQPFLCQGPVLSQSPSETGTQIYWHISPPCTNTLQAPKNKNSEETPTSDSQGTNKNTSYINPNTLHLWGQYDPMKNCQCVALQYKSLLI